MSTMLRLLTLSFGNSWPVHHFLPPQIVGCDTGVYLDRQARTNNVRVTHLCLAFCCATLRLQDGLVEGPSAGVPFHVVHQQSNHRRLHASLWQLSSCSKPGC